MYMSTDQPISAMPPHGLEHGAIIKGGQVLNYLLYAKP
jgi:hypothetical protein